MHELLNRLLLPDPQAEVDRLVVALRGALKGLHRRGVVLGLSGGVDSTVVAHLAVAALGPSRVLGLFLDERDSSADTRRLSRVVAEGLGIETREHDITGALEAFGCYREQDAAIRTAEPDYGPGWRSKLVLPSVLESDAYRVFSVVLEDPAGKRQQRRLSPEGYLGLVAATNFKQRVRKTWEYYWADRLVYAVAGTPNRLEYDQGFFVKNGDGAADVKPIAHLYKTQVYQLAEVLGVPREVTDRPPTTDTYSLEQTQEEFFFSLPYHAMDVCLFARSQGVAASEVAAALGLSGAAVERVFRDIDGKRRNAEYLRAEPRLLAEGVPVPR